MKSQEISVIWIGENKEAATNTQKVVNSVQNGLLKVDMLSTIEDSLHHLREGAVDLVMIEDDGPWHGKEWWASFEYLTQKAPVLIVTAGNKPDFVFSALKSGARDFISSVRPNPEDLLKSIRHAMGSFHLTKEVQELKRNNLALKEQFLAAQKMESVGRLALGVAHDFNNLLTVILNYSQMITSNIKDDESLRKKMDAITNCAQRAASITSQFLAFGRRNRPKPQAISLGSMFSIVNPLFRQTLGSEIELKTLEVESDLQVFMDPNHLMHVMMSMAQSAHESMPGGGKLTVSTSSQFVDDDRSNQLGGIASGEYVVISFQDTGKGYDPDTIEHIFELFGEKNAPASLSAVNSIVKHCGGHILVESELSKWARFDIYLPKYVQEVEIVTPSAPVVSKEKLAEKILIVDDEEMVRKIAVDVITNQGYRVVEAANAIEALKICEQSNEPIDLVLTDLIMPKMNGPELVSKIVSKNPHLRVVYMSGYADDAFEHNAALESKELFVQKPFLPKNLVTTVKNALESLASQSK